MSAGDESADHTGDFPAPRSPGDAVRNPAQVSFWLLEPTADAAMTYFYGQLFAMDQEIRARFPAAMDVQRRRFFQARTHIAEAQDDRDTFTGYLEKLGCVHRKFGVRARPYDVSPRALMETLHGLE